MVGMPEASDAQLVERLTKLGMEAWLAEHLVQWLPDAAALHCYPFARLNLTYTSGALIYSLDDEPIFRAALDGLATHAAHQLECLADRSELTEFIERAMDKAEDEGRTYDSSRPLNLSIAISSPLPQIEPGDGGVPRVNATFQRHLTHHGFKALPEGMAFEAFIYPTITSDEFYLDIDLTVSDARIAKGFVREAVLGEGITIAAAVKSAVTKLELNVMHVFFASLVDHRSCADQVFWEDWQHQLGALRVCHGGELHFYNPDHIPSFAPLLEELKAALAQEPLASGFHALRIFTSHQGERTLGEEVRLDGELWPRGMEVIRAHAWPHVEVPWGVRFFALMEASSEVN